MPIGAYPPQGPVRHGNPCRRRASGTRRSPARGARDGRRMRVAGRGARLKSRASERRGVQAMVSLDEERSDPIERVPSRQFAASDARRARDVGEKDRGGVHAPDDDSRGDDCSRPDAPRQLLRTTWLRGSRGQPLARPAGVDPVPAGCGRLRSKSKRRLPAMSHHMSTVNSAMSILVSTAAGAHAARGRATARSRVMSVRGSAAHTLTDWHGGTCGGRCFRPLFAPIWVARPAAAAPTTITSSRTQCPPPTRRPQLSNTTTGC